MIRCLPVFVLFVFAATAIADDGVTILPLGDSITAGGVGGGGFYRHHLNKLLSAAEREFNFVGPKVDKRGLRHAGYPGWDSNKVKAITEEVFTKHPADIVLLHMAHNHFAENDPVDTIFNNTREVIRIIAKKNPEVTVFLAQSITAGKLPKYSYIPALNERLATLASTLADEQIKVVLVDQATGFDWTIHTVKDKVHPNEAGVKKMACVWAKALASEGFDIPLTPVGDLEVSVE